MSQPQNKLASGDDPFGSTNWSMVVAAGTDGTLARVALGALCETYWVPVYGYVRSRGANVNDAHDLTQGFFASLLERNIVAAADPSRGRFRAFLLTSLKNFLANQHAYEKAKKRGGGQMIVSLNRDTAENPLLVSRREGHSPDREFERQWALAVLNEVLKHLSEEQTAAGREAEFALLKPFLTGEEGPVSQADIAHSLNSTPDAVRAAIYRLRKRYRALLRREVERTVASPEEVDEELQRLILAVSS